MSRTDTLNEQHADNSDAAEAVKSTVTEQTTTTSDESFARDMQMAYDLQAREELKMSRGIAGVSPQQHMLLVRCRLDGKPMELLVDTGASSSVISIHTVRRMGLETCINTSVQGRAMGIGTSSIVGVLEGLVCEIGHVECQPSFLVLDTALPYCIFGLDQLRRFKCIVDLQDNVLVFGGKDGVTVPFLSVEEATHVANEASAIAGQVSQHRRQGPVQGLIRLLQQY